MLNLGVTSATSLILSMLTVQSLKFSFQEAHEEKAAASVEAPLGAAAPADPRQLWWWKWLPELKMAASSARNVVAVLPPSIR